MPVHPAIREAREELVREHMAATILRQLGVAHDPLTVRGRVATVLNHPLTIGRALVRGLRQRRPQA